MSLETLQRDYDYEPAGNDFEVVFAESSDLYQALFKRQRKIARDLAKDEIKEELGRSLDFGDTLMMRMYFELDPAPMPDIR